MRGADLLVRTLSDSKVKTIFTLSGNQIMPVFDACIDTGIELVHVRHEAAAVYMADAWGQLTGKIGVALVAAGPGFANCLSSLYSARANESPVLLLTGDSPTTEDGQGAFQELLQTQISKPVVKASHRSCSVENLQNDVAAAICTAHSGRPGPVHIAVPLDVLNSTDTTSINDNSFTRVETTFSSSVVAQLIDFLTRSNKPIVFTGPALNGTRFDLKRLAESLDAPVVAIESPRGLQDPTLGDFKLTLAEADCVVFFGKRVDFTLNFGQTPTFNNHCRFLALDAEPESLDKAKHLLGGKLITVQTDARIIAHALIDKNKNPKPSRGRETWRDRVAAAIASRNYEITPSSLGRVLPSTLCHAVQQVLNAASDPILICDGGEFGQWAQALLRAKTRIINGPAGAIGGGLCYAVAAKIRRPQATVIVLMGDGTIGFNLSEFETAVRHNAPLVAVVGNDARWNAEHQIQLRDYGEQRLIGCELGATRYDLAVAGLGGHGEYVNDPLELDQALARALRSGLPACINVEVEGLPAP